MPREQREAAPLWTPTPEQVARARMTRFIEHVRVSEPDAGVTDYASLYAWSVAKRERFWELLFDFCDVVSDDGWTETLVGRDRVAPPDPVLGPRWFVGARLNFAENLLRHTDEREALVAWNELGPHRRLTYAELHVEVARLASALRAQGVREG